MTAPNVTARILRLIVENAPISQSDLKVRSGLSMSTVSQATNRLLAQEIVCLLYTSPSPRDLSTSRMPSSA